MGETSQTSVASAVAARAARAAAPGLIAVLLVLVGCGQKGPLRLPERQATGAAAPASQAASGATR